MLNLKKKKKIQNRKITKARFLYLYFVFGSIAAFTYYTLAVFYNWPKHWSFTPVYLLASYIALIIIKKNWKLILLYITDMEQGRLLLFLNRYTHFEEKHKMALLNWVYLKRGTIRRETYSKLTQSLLESKNEATKEERRMLKLKPVYCPQQLRDGFNEAMLINALIYAHRNIQCLDDDLLEIVGLTPDRIIAFDLNKEYDKCTNDKYRKMQEVGEKASKRLKQRENG